MAKTYTGAVVLAGIAIIVSGVLIWMAEKKAAAVGRRFVFLAIGCIRGVWVCANSIWG